MSDMPKEDQNSLNELGSVLLKSLSKDALRTLSLAHDCGYLDTIMDKEVNPKVAEYFPEDFVNPDPDDDIVCNMGHEEDGIDPYLKGIMERDELEDIDDGGVADRMILDGEGFEWDTYGSEL